jgi:hypothetical protein
MAYPQIEPREAFYLHLSLKGCEERTKERKKDTPGLWCTYLFHAQLLVTAQAGIRSCYRKPEDFDAHEREVLLRAYTAMPKMRNCCTDNQYAALEQLARVSNRMLKETKPIEASPDHTHAKV